MSKTLANILHDPETNYLWLHDNTRDEDNFIHTPDGIVDLGACLQEQGEIVNVLHFGFAIASAELIVAKDKNGNYTAFILYKDSMGEGGIYVSITPGFSFRSIWGFANNVEIYIIGEDTNNKWGMIRITHNHFSLFSHAPYTPIEIVPFSNSNIDEVIAKYPLPLHPENPFWGEGVVDLTMATDKSLIGFNGNGVLGKSLADIHQSRIINFFPQDKNECLIQIDDDLSFFKDEIARAASFTNKKSAWMRDRLHRRFLCHPQSTLMMAKLFGLTEPLIIGDPDLMAAYLLSKYQQEILKHKD